MAVVDVDDRRGPDVGEGELTESGRGAIDGRQLAEDPIAEFLRQPVWAVVGASNDPNKWGHRIFLTLLRRGYRVYPVNPRAPEVAGEPAYPSLSALPERPDVVDTVVPPGVTEMVVAEAARLGIRRIWMQPGSESARAIAIGESAGMMVIHDACVLVEGAGGRGPGP